MILIEIHLKRIMGTNPMGIKAACKGDRWGVIKEENN